MLTSLFYYGKVMLIYHCLQVDKYLLINLCLKLSRLRQLKNTSYLSKYVCMLICMYVTAVLKAVSLSGGHTVATELPTSMGIKQSSSLRLTMYVCM